MEKLVEVLNNIPNGPQSVAGPLTRLANNLLSNIATHPVRGAILPNGLASWKQASGPAASPVWFAFSGKVLEAM